MRTLLERARGPGHAHRARPSADVRQLAMADINAAIQISGYRETAPETISDTIVRIPALPRSVTPLSEGTSALQAAAVAAETIKPGDGKGTGSGFFISRDGYLLTNQHVLGRQECTEHDASLSGPHPRYLRPNVSNQRKDQ
jgi:S1-C subfamily serine protease